MGCKHNRHGTIIYILTTVPNAKDAEVFRTLAFLCKFLTYQSCIRTVVDKDKRLYHPGGATALTATEHKQTGCWMA